MNISKPFLKKCEMVAILQSGIEEKLIHEKNLIKKSRVRVNVNFNFQGYPWQLGSANVEISQHLSQTGKIYKKGGTECTGQCRVFLPLDS